MGNIIDVFDKEGKKIGYSSHSLLCAAYVKEIAQKYNPNFNMYSPDDINEQLEIVYEKCSKADDIVLLLFINDKSTFTEEDIPYFKEAIANANQDDRVHENARKHLTAYLEVLEKHKFIRTEYVATTSAIRVHTSE